MTGFQAYLGGPPVDPSDEEFLEPMDRRGYPVDMDHNGIRDRRETLTQAWQRRWQEGAPALWKTARPSRMPAM